MQTNKTISINFDLLRRVTDKLPQGQTFSGLLEVLLERWEKRAPERVFNTGREEK